MSDGCLCSCGHRVVGKEGQLTNEDAGIGIDLELAPDELNFSRRIADSGLQSELDTLDLLRDSTEHALFESVKLVLEPAKGSIISKIVGAASPALARTYETAPCPDLAQTDENAAHGLKVERLVTAEDKDESSELGPERLH